MHPTTTQLTGMGRFDSAEVVRARRQFDQPFTASARENASAALTGVAEVSAARRRFDGALGREGRGGAESFQPRFTGAPVADEPLLVVDLESGRPVVSHRRISQVTPLPPLLPSSFDGERTPAPPAPPAETDAFAGAVAKLRTLGALRNEGLITDAEYAIKRVVFLDQL